MPESLAVQVWFRCGSDVVQMWFRCGSGVVQVRVKVAEGLAVEEKAPPRRDDAVRREALRQ